MPRPQNTQIVGSDAARADRPRETALATVANPVNTFAAPAADNEFTQLAQGLGALHEPLARMQAQQDRDAREAAIREAKARAEQATNPQTADASDLIDRTPPAYRQDVQFAFQDGIGQRLGVQAKQDYLDAYSKASQDPNFNLDKFTADFRQEHLAGLPASVAIHTASQLDSGIEVARGEHRRLLEKRAIESRNANLAAAYSGIDFTADVTRQMIDRKAATDTYVAAGGTPAEATKALLSHVEGRSVALGGRPDLFSIFDQEVEGLGMKLADTAGLREAVEKAKHQATLQQKNTINETTLVTRAEQLDGINKMLEDGTAVKMGEAAFAAHLKQFMSSDGSGALTEEGYVSHMTKFRAALAVEHDKAYTAQVLADGKGWLLTEKQAGPVLAAALDRAGVMDALAKGASGQASPEVFSQAANAVVAAHDGTKVAFVDKRLKGAFDALLQSVPKPGEPPSNQFVAMSRLYGAMARSSKPLAQAYAGDKVGPMLDAFNRATTEGQVNPTEAVRQAYAMVDPENIKAAEERVQKDPSFRATVADKSRSAMRSIFGSGGAAASWRFLPGMDTLGFRPQTGAMEKWAGDMALNYVKLNPTRSDDEVIDYVKSQAESNWFFEPTSKAYVQLPPALNNEHVQKAITGYLDAVKAQNPDSKPELTSEGNGLYTLHLTPNGSPVGVAVAQHVPVQTMLALRNAQTGLDVNTEVPALRELKAKIVAGTATPEDIKGNEFALSKARTMGLWDANVQQKADQAVAKAAVEKSVTQLEPAIRTAMTRGEYNVSAAVKPKGSFTAGVAQQFLQQGDHAGALTVMAEGIATKVYSDSKGAHTIGVGYNMDANAKTLAEDFRKAGIPPELAPEIKAGTRHITIEQAMRLYQAVKPRYEAAARDAVDKSYPGEWNKLAPNVQAVLTDLAYQTGPAGVAKFKDGLSRLFQGDLSGSGFETSYLKPSGERVTDSRRHTLRTAMLRNTTSFQTLLTHASKQPANALQAGVLARGATP
jgi:GH24 family phage-related lysozyme (muramidase)